MKGSFIKIFLLLLISFNLVIKGQDSTQLKDTTSISAIDSSKIILTNSHSIKFDTQLSEVFYSSVNKKLSKPLKVRVLYEGVEPVKNIPVYFEVFSQPQKSKGLKIFHTVVYTDSNGYAQTEVQLGSVEGEYEFSARIKINSTYNDIIYFKAIARKSNWVFFLISGLVGGLALFLFGMEIMSEGMKKTAGSKLRLILETLTTNRLIAVAVGTIITTILQSSSATTVMLVSFVQAQLISFSQTLGIILGAGIGTTITAQLIAFKVTDYSLIVVGVGFGISFLGKSKKIKSVGEFILGFGLVFYGMYVMSEAMFPLRTYQPFIDSLMHLENPFLGLLVGTIFTALIQSSGAFIGILIVLGSQGLITLEAAIPLILGANIGTSITAILASISTGREAKRVAIAHTFAKVFGVLLFIWWIPYFAEFVRSISPKGPQNLSGLSYLADVVPRQIANAHTIFNVALTIILLPFINVAAKFIEKVLPDIPESEVKSIYKTKFLEDSLISTPALALNLAKAEIIRMATKAQKMVENIIVPFLSDNEKIIEMLEFEEKELNYLNVSISKYLIKISQKSLPEETVDEVFQMIHCVTELEEIGDVVFKRLVPLAKERIERNIKFSDEGKSEIEDYHLRTMKQISRAIEVLKEFNLVEAKRMEKKYKKYRLMEIDLRRTHFDRVRQEIPQSVESSGIHLQLIDSLKRISSNATNVARIFLELKSDKKKSHQKDYEDHKNSEINNHDEKEKTD